ncbi:hypothetical protein GDO81_005355 [Engystomops pustulosus]|uniref:Secreted protein n=1 Tax=Engystomops pustulosus TaxID=76066 RepID=A0AAV7CMM1_ENGPU|nr:hypothetical protein GDO81_005355 [Engystomops pustulosus]
MHSPSTLLSFTYLSSSASWSCCQHKSNISHRCNMPQCYNHVTPANSSLITQNNIIQNYDVCLEDKAHNLDLLVFKWCVCVSKHCYQ